MFKQMLLNGYYDGFDNIVDSDLDKFIQGVGMLNSPSNNKVSDNIVIVPSFKSNQLVCF